MSGLCALVYQIGWMREFRLIFGASTAASAAVVAIFIGGLGAGGIIIGRRVDKHPRPLMLYGWLEICIAAGAALSPLVVQMLSVGGDFSAFLASRRMVHGYVLVTLSAALVGTMFALRKQAQSLMKLPTGDGTTTAGPTFEYVPPEQRN